MKAELRRMRWRCRRGMLELDIILLRFLNNHYTRLSAEELTQFDRLLSLADNDLWDMICARKPPIDEDQRPILTLLQNC